jgi:hypothetical protein
LDKSGFQSAVLMSLANHLALRWVVFAFGHHKGNLISLADFGSDWFSFD